MDVDRLRTRVQCCALLVAAWIGTPLATSAQASNFETPPTVRAADVAPESLLAGAGFRVDPEVPTDGLTTHFVIRSDVGEFRALGAETLALRVAEIPALQELSRASKTKVFLGALAATAKKPVESAVQMVKDPVGTAKGIPSGLGRFFDRVGSGAERLAQAATDSSKSGTERAGEVAGMTGSVTADALGYEKELRMLAKQLGVDPYTTNEVLAAKMREFAQVAFAGHVGLNTLIAVVVPASIAISGTNITHDLVYDTPRGDLIVRNERKLRAMGVSDPVLRSLQRSPGFTLSTQTALVESLGRLQGVDGRADVVALAATAENSDQALFLTRAVHRLAVHHAKTAALSALTARGTVIGREKSGRFVVPGPVDYVTWGERLAHFAGRDDLAGDAKLVLVTGFVSPRAREELEKRGFEVRDHDPVAGY